MRSTSSLPASASVASRDPLPDLLGWLRELGVHEPELEQMPGGASTRRFYRATLPGGRSAVAMFFPDASVPDEIVKTSETGRRWPFLEVRELLEARGVHVPRLLGERCEQGLLLMEDLGEDTLANYLKRVPAAREPVYRQAVRDLAQAQQRLAQLPEGSIVAARAFDEELLRWELDHFREYGLEARGLHLDDRQRAAFDAAADHLASSIAQLPRGFVHRDYQSRNLMVRIVDDDAVELVWLDFQDALLGPRCYDLVALLNDSYQVFDAAFIEARLDDFTEAQGLSAPERRALGEEFQLVTVQRKLKDAGRFIYLDVVKHNPSFLGFVESTIDKARGALRQLATQPKHARLLPLLELLSKP